MSMPLLELRGVGKDYQQWEGEWRRVLSWFGLPLRPRHEHWVLQDVSSRHAWPMKRMYGRFL